MRVSITSGSLFNGFAIIGTGAAVMFPEQRWIGAIIILIGILALVFDIRVERGHVAVGSPQSLRQRLRRVWPQYLMVVSGVGFFVGVVAFLQLNVTAPKNGGGSSDYVPKGPAINSGMLSPSKVVFSSATKNADRRLEIGDSGAMLVVGMIQFGSSNLVLEVIDGKLKITTQVQDENGNLIAELIRNEWKIAVPPIAWDRNYTDNALEVRNAKGRIVLQVVLLSDRIRLQGEWRSPDGHGVRIVKDRSTGHGQMIAFIGSAPPSASEIEPLFVYPSDTHFGELRN